MGKIQEQVSKTFIGLKERILESKAKLVDTKVANKFEKGKSLPILSSDYIDTEKFVKVARICINDVMNSDIPGEIKPIVISQVCTMINHNNVKLESIEQFLECRVESRELLIKSLNRIISQGLFDENELVAVNNTLSLINHSLRISKQSNPSM